MRYNTNEYILEEKKDAYCVVYSMKERKKEKKHRHIIVTQHNRRVGYIGCDD